MGQIRPSPPRSAMLGQLALSVTATVAATLIVTGIQRELGEVHTGPARAEMTSGGKFAARVEALRTASDETAAVVSAPLVPLLVADASLHTIPLTSVDSPAPAAGQKAAEPARGARHLVAHAEPRRRSLDVDVVPPRRSDAMTVALSAPVSTVSDAGQPGVWATTKGLYRQAVWLGGEALDRVNPMNLLP